MHLRFSRKIKRNLRWIICRIIAGTAPEAMEELPAPTHAFIGGSSGNMKEIVELLLEKNPQVRMVINCITLETVGEALACIKEMRDRNAASGSGRVKLCSSGVSRSKEIGRYHMMMGENPIYIITIQAHKNGEFCMKAARILLAAGASGSGKTLITCGLLQALVESWSRKRHLLNVGRTISIRCSIVGSSAQNPEIWTPFLQTVKLQNISSVKMRWTVIFLLWKE